MMSRLVLPLVAIVASLAAINTHGAAIDGKLTSRAAAPDNIVYVTNKSDFCITLPRHKHQNIGDSEYPGGTKTFCTKPYDSSQGTLPAGFIKTAHVSHKAGRSGGRQVQLTACINPSATSRLNANDDGGQYDGMGGDGGKGNPAGSECLGYGRSWVSIVEPSGNRLCLRCCENPSDCDVSQDTSGCGTVIPGNYEGC